MHQFQMPLKATWNSFRFEKAPICFNKQGHIQGSSICHQDIHILTEANMGNR
jgi:hypothetical protein